jgi:hypothetical protein
MGGVHLEQILGCPEEHMTFHLWYLRENGWVQRLDNGMLAITASGVDRVMELGGPMAWSAAAEAGGKSRSTRSPIQIRINLLDTEEQGGHPAAQLGGLLW